MGPSELIAGLLGPVLMAIGIASLSNRQSLEAMAGQMPSSLPIVFLAGLLLLVAGLSIVRAHNVWAADWRILVTLAGWSAVSGGLVRMLIPEHSAAVAAAIVKNRPAVILAGSISLLLGGYLTVKGYHLADWR
jgi:hypothetical protein